jgi:thymidylate synthase ThyX
MIELPGVSGQIILDSISPEGIRLTTVHMRYPRMIHSELMTHRDFSRNGRSSRAVPVMTLMAEASYIPHFMKNKPGMVASEEMEPSDLLAAQAVWYELSEYTKRAVEALHKLGVHKQWSNRPLEAFGFIDVLISSTNWANFFALRDDCGAQPEIESVAKLIKQLMDNSKPQLLKSGQWHLPYIDEEKDTFAVKEYLNANRLDWRDEPTRLAMLKKISTSRCARLSIRPFDNDSSIEKELARYEKLVVSRPVHASPAEHIATPDTQSTMHSVSGIEYKVWDSPELHGNFYGWQQYRKLIPDNTIKDR